MPTTRQSENKELQQAVDHSELLTRKKKKKMAHNTTKQDMNNGGTPVPPQNENPEENSDSETEDTTRGTPSGEMYLPDLNNTPFSEAIKRGINWGNNEKLIIECPKLMQFFGTNTLLIHPPTGEIRLYDKDEVEDFPVNCSTSRFLESLLTKVLENAASQHARPKDLPGKYWTTFSGQATW